MKTRIKRLISILCIVTVFAGTILTNQFLSAKAETPDEQLETLPTNLTEITFSDFGFDNGDYTWYPSESYTGPTMKDTLFGGRITFPDKLSSGLQYAGKADNQGFNLLLEENDTGEKCLHLFPTGSMGSKRFDHYLNANDAGLESFVNKEFLLHISMEYVDYHDDGKTDDVKLGIWFEKKLYDNRYFYLEDFVNTSFSVGNKMCLYTSNMPIKVKSYHRLPEERLTKISFLDFGFVDGVLRQGVPHQGQYDGPTMNNTLFSGKITFPKIEHVFLQYGGKVAGGGFNFGTAYNAEKDEWYLRLFDARPYGGAPQFAESTFYSKTAEVTLVGEELDFNLTMEYVTSDSVGEMNDVKLGVWFNGQLYNGKYITLYNFVDNSHSVGTWMSFYSGAGVDIKSVGELNWKPLPTGMTEITFRDFGFLNGPIRTHEDAYGYGQYEGETLDNTLFSGTITFPKKANVFLQYGGKKAGGGFNLGTAQDENTGEWYLRLFDTGWTGFASKDLYSDVAQVPLVGEELELNISMEYVTHDDVGEMDDVKLGVWFGGKLYSNQYIYLDNYVNKDHCMGTMMSFYDGIGVKIESAGAVNWKSLPTGMTEITFRDFGFIDGKLEIGYPSGKYDGETLDNTLFSGKITFPEKKDVYLQYGGKVAGGGFNLGTGYNDISKEWYLRLYDTRWSGFAQKSFYSDVAEVPLVGEELELNISMEYVDHDNDGAKDDVKLGVWFGGKLYNNEYIYLDNYVYTSHCMGTVMSFYDAQGVDIESVGTINWKDLPTGMTEITFRDFGFIDGDTTGYPSGQYEGTTLDNTMFIGKITFPEATDAHLMYGGKMYGGGLDFVPEKNEETGEWYLRMFDTRKGGAARKFDEVKFYPHVAGVPLVGKEVAMILTMQYVDHDGGGTKNDVKLGVWFGGKLYNNNYIYLDNFVDHSHSMGTWMGFDISKGSIINLKSVGEINWKPLPTDFTQLTFSDYGIKAGVYEGGSRTGTCDLENMDRTLFSGIVTYSTVGETHFTFGGKTSLSGLDLVNVYNEETGEHYLRLFDTNANNELKSRKFDMNLYSRVAGVTLVGEELDLKISLEYVDYDADGAKDDLKLGIWFANKLYNNRYIYVTDYVNLNHCIGNKLTIWNRNGSSFNVGRISEWLDWSAFGLTANWKKTLLDTDFNLKYALAGGNPNTGDSTKYPYVTLISCLAVIVLCGYGVVRRRKKEDGIHQ